MPTKDETAQLLADAHFNLDQGVTRIFRIDGPDETADHTPVKLLEVNPQTTEAGIMPIGFAADARRDVFHASVVIEVTPAEFGRVARGELRLPHGWVVGRELFPSRQAAGAAS
jgi:hypothetical protein